MIVIDLPRPTSANRLWRSGNKHVYKSKEYLSWIKEAGDCWMQQKPKLKTRSIEGWYSMKLIFTPPDLRRRDIGNLEKACSDFAQSMGIIEDDAMCAHQEKDYGFTPLGVRLIFEPAPIPGVFQALVDKR